MSNSASASSDSSADKLPRWVKSLSEEEATRKESWPPRANDRDIPWDSPSHEIYYDPDYDGFSDDFEIGRQKLDYNYHRNPAKARQELQDVIMHRVVKATKGNSTKEESETKADKRHLRPWLVFSAGPMGVGKGYVLSTLNEKGLFPLDRFLKIDPDKLKTELPEMSGYLSVDPTSAATKVHRESTQMADVLLEHALYHGLSALVDGSLRDVDFYGDLIDRIRKEFPDYQLGIIHVTASPDIIRSRAESRAKKTGRAVPEKLLQESIEQVPKSVDKLSTKVDVTFTIRNEEDQPLELIPKDGWDPNESTSRLWEEFRANWWRNIDSSSDEEEQNTPDLLPAWCESMCPGLSRMGQCFDNTQLHEQAKQAWIGTYPNFCPRCTMAKDSQCGICIHEKHFCACHECSPLSAQS